MLLGHSLLKTKEGIFSKAMPIVRSDMAECKVDLKSSIATMGEETINRLRPGIY